MFPQVRLIALPKLSVSETVQKTFANFDLDTRFRIFNEIKSAFEKAVSVEGQFQKELEKCKTLVELGASNALILKLLVNINENDIAYVRKSCCQISLGGRIQLMDYKKRHKVYQRWLLLFDLYHQSISEFDRWILLANDFYQYSLGELHKAVCVAQQECVNDE